jgi:hypothetical protein
LVDRRVVVPVLSAVKTEARAKLWLKLNSCYHPQKQRIGSGYVCTVLFPSYLYLV